MVTYAYNISTWESETGKLLFLTQAGLQTRMVSKMEKRKRYLDNKLLCNFTTNNVAGIFYVTKDNDSIKHRIYFIVKEIISF